MQQFFSPCFMSLLLGECHKGPLLRNDAVKKINLRARVRMGLPNPNQVQTSFCAFRSPSCYARVFGRQIHFLPGLLLPVALQQDILRECLYFVMGLGVRVQLEGNRSALIEISNPTWCSFLTVAPVAPLCWKACHYSCCKVG